MTKLYKYRSFNVNSLTELCDSEVYFSNPQRFNDPLDCSPTLINDMSLVDIEKITHRIVLKNYNKDYANNRISHWRYMSTEYGGDYKTDRKAKELYISLLMDEVKRQLDFKMKGRGVLSLASQWDSPLMWSHYAEEHKGICIEYDISTAICGKPKEIDYLSDRGILLSKVSDFIFNDSIGALNEIEQKYFYTKANQWNYEQEWRYVTEEQGVTSAPFQLSAIYFGMQCKGSVISSIVKLLNHSESDLDFFQAYASQSSFEIHKRKVDVDEIMACTPRLSGVDIADGFKAIEPE